MSCRIASILTQSATKVVLTVYNFNFPITLCLAQMLFTAPLCAHISGSSFDFKLFKALLPLGLVNGMLLMASFRVLSLACVTNEFRHLLEYCSTCILRHLCLTVVKPLPCTCLGWTLHRAMPLASQPGYRVMQCDISQYSRTNP